MLGTTNRDHWRYDDDVRPSIDNDAATTATATNNHPIISSRLTSSPPLAAGTSLLHTDDCYGFAQLRTSFGQRQKVRLAFKKNSVSPSDISYNTVSYRKQFARQ